MSKASTFLESAGVTQLKFGSLAVSGAAAISNLQRIRNSVMQAKFPRSARLRRRADFERIYKLGRRHFGSHLTVFYLVHEECRGLRVGFTVGRVLGGAVVRNRMKRQLREVVRLNWPPVPLRADVVIHPKKSALKAKFSELNKEVARAFEILQVSLAKPGREGQTN